MTPPPVGDEEFQQLGGDKEKTNVGEVVYRDASRVLTRMWNYRDSDVTKIVDGTDGALATRNFMLFVEEVDMEETTQHELEAAMANLAESYGKVFVGDFEWKVFNFDEGNNSVEL
ncbi:hypothetical protein BC937DRAFT_89998 [Endogone sp. FLAS-F59071]|nr:hypothetical protein BC937DRAFT_89998 [Endogone sp. FLAS-F59071]|eukprot:RUS22210.1 hypothetical protein BC937DRAFT_89998 [Endogone sp. FLAS-F59071]